MLAIFFIQINVRNYCRIDVVVIVASIAAAAAGIIAPAKLNYSINRSDWIARPNADMIASFDAAQQFVIIYLNK